MARRRQPPCKHSFVWQHGKLTGVLYQVCKLCCLVQKWEKVGEFKTQELPTP